MTFDKEYTYAYPAFNLHSFIHLFENYVQSFQVEKGLLIIAVTAIIVDGAVSLTRYCLSRCLPDWRVKAPCPSIGETRPLSRINVGDSACQSLHALRLKSWNVWCISPDNALELPVGATQQLRDLPAYGTSSGTPRLSC